MFALRRQRQSLSRSLVAARLTKARRCPIQTQCQHQAREATALPHQDLQAAAPAHLPHATAMTVVVMVTKRLHLSHAMVTTAAAMALNRHRLQHAVVQTAVDRRLLDRRPRAHQRRSLLAMEMEHHHTQLRQPRHSSALVLNAACIPASHLATSPSRRTTVHQASARWPSFLPRLWQLLSLLLRSRYDLSILNQCNIWRICTYIPPQRTGLE